MLERYVDVGADVVVGGDGIEQVAGDFVWVRVKETNPMQAFDAGELFQQERQTIFQAEVFAVAGCVLPDESYFAHAGLGKTLRFGNDGFEAARAELAAQLRDDAEGAGMIAAFGNFDIGRMTGRREDARCVIVIKIVGQIGNGAVPGIAREASLFAATVAFGARGQDFERAVGLRSRGDSGGGENVFQFTGADNGVDFRNILLNVIAKALDETSGHYQPLRFPAGFVSSHFEDCVDRFLLRAADEGAGVDDDYVGVFGGRSEFNSGLREHTH